MESERDGSEKYTEGEKQGGAGQAPFFIDIGGLGPVPGQPLGNLQGDGQVRQCSKRNQKIVGPILRDRQNMGVQRQQEERHAPGKHCGEAVNEAVS